MFYTEEEIKKYLDILHNYNKPIQQVSEKAQCLDVQIQKVLQ